MSLEKDGSQFYFINGDLVVSSLSSGQVNTICNESIDSVTPSGTVNNKREYLVVLFPEKRDLKGWYAVFSTLSGSAINNSSGTSRIEVSTDTTNGLDGTWSSIGTLTTPSPLEVVPGYRDDIATVNALGIKGVRFAIYKSWDCDIHTVHLYGTITAGENPQRLALWHPTLDQALLGANLDWGDCARGSSADKTFRVKNMHSSLTANSVVLGTDILTDGSPSVPAQFLVSLDGSSFASTQTITSISPGAISAVCYVRRTTPTNAQLGVWAPRLNAEPGSWT